MLAKTTEANSKQQPNTLTAKTTIAIKGGCVAQLELAGRRLGQSESRLDTFSKIKTERKKRVGGRRDI